MSVLSDKSIRKLAVEQSMISPFIDKQVRDGKISYGLSSFGYDARVGDEFKIFHNVNSSIVDPKEFSSDNFVTKKALIILSFLLILSLLELLLKSLKYQEILCVLLLVRAHMQEQES
jgi:deoxycytidine triphosphate deaminase